MRLLLTIFLLAVLLCKITESMVVALRFTNAMETPLSELVNTEEQIELKIYMPLPYSSDWENKNPFPESVQRGNNFYTIVERRYVNDTFYVKMQCNHNAREQFDALSRAVNSFLANKDQDKKQSSKTTIVSLDDLIKIFPPPSPATIVKADKSLNRKSNLSIWYFKCPSLTAHTALFIPPPECV